MSQHICHIIDIFPSFGTVPNQKYKHFFSKFQIKILYSFFIGENRVCGTVKTVA
jgi:hypothetical protein